MSTRVRIVCATRLSSEEFASRSALGRSLSLYRLPVELRLFPQNALGLGAVYNEALREAAADPAILMFMHDDLHLCDFFWASHVVQGLIRFDVIGVAGNRRRVTNQPAWLFVDSALTWDSRENLSGTVGHGKGFPCSNLSVYGSSSQEVKLLDGVLLAAHSEVLRSRSVSFDERFEFNFYDMDFCRQAEARGLRLGTWPISVVHESGGAFGSPSWQAGYTKYLEKWRS